MGNVQLSPAQRKLIKKMVKNGTRIYQDGYWTWRLDNTASPAVREETIWALEDAKLLWHFPKRGSAGYYKTSSRAKRLYENGDL